MGPQPRQHAADQLHDVAAQAFDGPRAVNDLGRITSCFPGNISCINLDGSQALTQLIMQLPRQALTLFLLRLDDTAIEVAPLCRSLLHRPRALVESLRDVIDVLETESWQARLQVPRLELGQCRLDLGHRSQPLANHSINGPAHG